MLAVIKTTNMKLIGTFSFLLFFFISDIFSQNSQNYSSPVEKSFVKPLFAEMPLGAIKPKGWLLNQLVVMRNGTSGHLDEVYSKLKDDNGWLGGKGDAWEETPYWLDGAVPLAYLLDDKELEAKVLKYINWTLTNQRPSGYFGGITGFERETGNKITEENVVNGGNDWWPKMLMLKVLQQYYSVSGDKRVINFLTNYFHFQLKTLKGCPIGKWTEWAQSRGAENIMIAQWLYTITNDISLLELGNLIESQSYPWSEWLGNRDWVIDAAAYQNDKNWMHRHGVNVAMGLKSPALNYQRTGDEKYLKELKTGFNDLMTLHGLPMGIFSADEDLHGNDPTQGAELCAIVESMFSLEQIIGITGDIQYMDALERMTFNALPTQTTDDYNAKQYFQIANQVQVKRGVFNFSLPFEREMNNVFGMRSGYTCCLANMHQGWTKFAQHLWYRTKENGLAALVFGPNELKTKVGQNNTEIVINESTNYPFEDLINFQLSTKNDVAFDFELRIPSWCKKALVKINGQDYSTEKGGNIIKIDRTWKNGDKITLQLPMEITTSNWGHNTRAVERGPLVYALKLDEKWEKANEVNEGDYFCVYPKGDWNYGLLEAINKNPENSVTVTQLKPDYNTFIWNLAHAPVELTARAKKIPGWILANDVASTPVTDRFGLFRGKVNDTIETITLIPYGCTKVRVVAFPVVR
jgi:uncharacterized protein